MAMLQVRTRATHRAVADPRAMLLRGDPGLAALLQGRVMIEGTFDAICLTYCSDFSYSRRRGNPQAANPGNNLHVSGLSVKVDTRDLEAAFSKVGRVSKLGFFFHLTSNTTLCALQVQKVQIMHDPHTRESRGFGFVTMETPEEADAAITALNATELFGKTMNVEKVV